MTRSSNAPSSGRNNRLRLLRVIERGSQVTPPEISRLARIKRNPVDLRISLLSGNRICIITQHCNDLSVLPVVLLMIRIGLIRNINADAVSLLDTLHWDSVRPRLQLVHMIHHGVKRGLAPGNISGIPL